MTKKIWRTTLKRIAAILLAGTLFIGAAGCGKKAAGSGGATGADDNTAAMEEGAKGRYMEAQKETPESLTNIAEMVRLADGSVAVYNPDTAELLISADNGDTWEAKKLSALEQQLNLGSDITANAIAPDGGFFFSYVQWGTGSDDAQEDAEGEDPEISAEEESEGESPKVDEHYVYINSAGDATELELSNEADVLYFQDAVFTGNTTLLCIEIGSSICKIDLEEKTIKPVAVSDPEAFADKVYCAGDFLLSDNAVYQISTGDTVEDTLFCEFIKQETVDYKRMAFYQDGGENIMYTASKSGLYSHVIGGSSMEQLLDGGLSNLGDPTKTVAGLLKNEDGSFLVAYEDGEIDQYTYDQDAPSVPSQQVTVYTLTQNTTVSKAISLFRKKNPDVFVKQEVGILGEYGVTKEDAIKNLNTKLLAGEGPDILLLDGMPMDSYVEKDALLDLSGVLAEMEGESSYFTNILRAYETENGVYAVPMRYRIPVLAGEKDVIKGISGLAAFKEAVKAAKEKNSSAETVAGTYTAEELLERMYLMMASSAFVKDGKLDAEAVKEFLAQAKEIYEIEQEKITPAVLEQHNHMLYWREDYGLTEEEGSFPVDASAVYDLFAGQQALYVGTLSGMQDFQYAEGLSANRETVAYDFLSGQQEGVFNPNGIIGINAKSKEQELAVSFVKELLGMDVQKSDLEDGFPVNADAYEEFSKDPDPDGEGLGFAASTASEDGSTDEMVEFSIGWPTDEAIAKLKEKIGGLTVCGLSDETIKAAVLEIGVKVLEGDRTVDEGCDEIVQKVGLYLAE